METAAQTFSSDEVRQRLGISYRRLDYWVRAGVVRPSAAQANGAGSQRRWTGRDLWQAAVLVALADLIGPSAQTSVLRSAASCLEPYDPDDVRDVLLVVDTTGAWIGSPSLVDRPSIVIPLEPISRMVRG